MAWYLFVPAATRDKYRKCTGVHEDEKEPALTVVVAGIKLEMWMRDFYRLVLKTLFRKTVLFFSELTDRKKDLH